MTHPSRLGMTFAFAALAGCASKPVTAPRAVVPEPVPSELRAATTPGKNFGDMISLGIGVSNGSNREYVVAADRVYAIDRLGYRVAALSVTEAARQAGGATALKSGLKGAGTGALLAALVGAIPGAVLGAAHSGSSGAGTGAAVGAGIGATAGALGGFFSSKSATERQIIDQLGELYLGEQVVKPGLSVSGFVFFPKGEYTGTRILAVEKASGTVTEVFGPMVHPATD
jgi:hypothetical protein